MKLMKTYRLIAFKTLCVKLLKAPFGMSTVSCKHRVFILHIVRAYFSFQQTDIGLLLCPREQLQGTCYWLYPKAFSFDCPYFENAFGWPESSCFPNFVWSNSFHSFDFKLKRTLCLLLILIHIRVVEIQKFISGSSSSSSSYTGKQVRFQTLEVICLSWW